MAIDDDDDLDALVKVAELMENGQMVRNLFM